MRTRIAVMCVVLLVMVAACGAPKSGGFSEIDQSRIPAPLTATTTTSTTTTTTIPATSTTLAEPAITTTTVFIPPTSTIASESVRVYYVIGRDKIVSINRQVAGEASVNQVMALLESAPTGEGTVNLRTALPPGEQPNATDVGRGKVTVDLSSTFREAVGEDQRLAIAQIVLTFTHRAGISQVTFTEDGEPTKVQLADGSQSDFDAILYAEDYETLLDSAPPAAPSTTTTTTSTTSTTTTTVPSTDVPVSDPTGEPTTVAPG